MATQVLAAVDIGIASEPYRETFRDARTFGQMLLAVEREMQKRSSNTRAFAQNITLSAWSAGYGAVSELLAQPTAQSGVGSVVLLDGLHAGFDGAGLDAAKLAPFLHFAKQAAEGKRLMFTCPSSIRTPGYASTTQTARYPGGASGRQTERHDCRLLRPDGPRTLPTHYSEATSTRADFRAKASFDQGAPRVHARRLYLVPLYCFGDSNRLPRRSMWRTDHARGETASSAERIYREYRPRRRSHRERPLIMSQTGD